MTRGVKVYLLTLYLLLLVGCKATNNVDITPQTLNQPNTAELQNNSELEKRPVTKRTEKKPEAELAIALPKSIAILPFNNLTAEAAAPAILRSTLFGHLASSNYRFPHIKDIDNRLAILDPKQKLQSNEAGFLTNLLDVDGLLFVDITSYDKLYVGVYAQITFSVSVTLVDVKGEILWKDDFEEISREGGVSLNALSMLYNIAVTAMHISDENLLAVADKLGRKIAVEFPQPEQYQQQVLSFIDTVLHDGINKVLKYGDALQVGIKGEANKLASVNIEGINQAFPLVEKEPGIYMASIAVDRRWNGQNLMLTGNLRDSSGAVSKYISSVGLISFDNIAPTPAKLLHTKIDQSRAVIQWQASEKDLHFAVFNTAGQSRKLLFETYLNEFVWQHQRPLFDNVNLAVVSIDKAGNQSADLSINIPIYPLATMYEATVVEQARLPSELTGQLILRRHFGPYVIDQNIIQAPGSSLFIEPGTEFSYTSAGQLVMRGSVFSFAQQAIKFKPLSSVMTAQIFLTLDSREHVDLNGFVINGAGIGIEVLQGSPIISNCQIINSLHSAIVVANTAAVKVQNCILQGSNTSAFVVSDKARVQISNSQFIDNFPFHIQSSSIYELQTSGNTWQPDASAMTILGNVRY
tara:strand:+ start:4160 stop:6067 length:1908 start_codon:yes stop_codon:yes gene_type:complete